MTPHFFQPKVRVSGLTVTIDACEYSSAEFNATGSVEAFSLSLLESDAGKFFALSLVRSGGAVHYQVIMQDSAVQSPLVPELTSSSDVLFPFMSGTVSQDGKSLTYSVRSFGSR